MEPIEFADAESVSVERDDRGSRSTQIHSSSNKGSWCWWEGRYSSVVCSFPIRMIARAPSLHYGPWTQPSFLTVIHECFEIKFWANDSVGSHHSSWTPHLGQFWEKNLGKLFFSLLTLSFLFSSFPCLKNWTSRTGMGNVSFQKKERKKVMRRIWNSKL